MGHTDGGGVLCAISCVPHVGVVPRCCEGNRLLRYSLSHPRGLLMLVATAVFATTLIEHGQQKRNLALCLKKRKSMADLRIGSIGGFGDDGITQESRPPASMEWANAKVEARVNEFWHLVGKKLHAAQAVQ